MASATSCACGSGVQYAACCATYHEGGEPQGTEELVRARFAAFVRGEHAFLYRTLHRDHDDRQGDAKTFAKRLAAHAKRARYRALTILDRDGPDADGIHRVLFHVDAAHAGRDVSFVELSSFVADEGGLRYVGGRGVVASALPRIEGLTIADLAEP